ncbi:MAG: SDR family NAD(P)-dependent oxidoreductase [Armatimonadota bacterium]|nr:SDR family NAD(P)-dependent oxidoreductase [Armatimonadota bacterium]MDR7439379.1 SDR family NAD(P)-dependent oxidoreductase [Armatimonadota bacterium]MDR7601878.1 SDR family NAD(P)-dependent oxidoreductase [Armatimonadota bacterium]
MQSMRLCDLSGMVALVTGAGGGARGGVGPMIARYLAQAGARVAVNDRTAERAEATVRELRDVGLEAEGFPADVADVRQADQLVERVVDRFGQLDILVNKAEYHASGQRADEVSDEEWETSLAVNVHAPFYLSRAAVRHMRPRRFGRIINVSNISAIRTSLLHGVPYVATKEALYGLTRHLAIEVAQHGITVNAILPGFILTPRILEGWPEERQSAVAATVPALRAGTPEEVAALVVFLASREAGYITGAAIPIDGAVSVVPGGGGGRQETAFV